MNTEKHKEPFAYREDAMKRTICLICGERLGDYNYRGKPVCTSCVEFIRANC